MNEKTKLFSNDVLKSILLIIVIITLTPSVAFSQSRIGAFYGIKLGMSKYDVKSKLESQGKSIVKKTMSSSSFDSEFYLIKKAQLGDAMFDELKLFFSNSKLVQANFVCSDGGGGSPSAPVYNRIESNAKKYKRIFNLMKASFMEKYGTPIMDEENEVIWRSGNQLSVKYVYNSEDSEMWKSINTMVLVVYKLSNGGSANY